MKDRQFKIIMIMLIVWLLFSVFMFFYFKNVCEIAKENPLKYGAEKYKIDQCICFTDSGKQFYFNKERVWYVKTTRAANQIELEDLTGKLDSLNITVEKRDDHDPTRSG